MAKEAKFLVVTKWYCHYGYWQYPEVEHMYTKTGKLAKFYSEESARIAARENNAIGIAPLGKDVRGLQLIGNPILI